MDSDERTGTPRLGGVRAACTAFFDIPARAVELHATSRARQAYAPSYEVLCLDQLVLYVVYKSRMTH